MTNKTKLLATVIMGTLIAGCSPSSENADNSYSSRPAHLRDCSIDVLRTGKGNNITVVRCPNSSTTTTYMSGKTAKSTAVIDQRSMPDTVTIDGVVYKKQ